MKFWIMGLLVIIGCASVPVALLTYGNLDVIKNRHLQLTTDKSYIENLTCKDISGNETLLETVTTFDVTQLKNDFKNLAKEKGCN